MVQEERVRLPAAIGSFVVSNQAAEDVGGVKALLICIQTGAVIIISDNQQTVLNIIGAGADGRMGGFQRDWVPRVSFWSQVEFMEGGGYRERKLAAPEETNTPAPHCQTT